MRFVRKGETYGRPCKPTGSVTAVAEEDGIYAVVEGEPLFIGSTWIAANWPNVESLIKGEKRAKRRK